MMKKVCLLSIVMSLFALTSYAGGLLTNSNQSAQFVRMLSRNASTQIDAVYYNPAGLMKLENGFHFALHNQSIFQTRKITTTAPLNNQEFIGDVTAPVFPSAFAVYKLDNLAFSLGFGPNGGGGSAEYAKGLPSFEGMVKSRLQPLGADGYDVDIAFKGQSVFWGLQAGVSARIGDFVSGYVGVRYLPSANTYTGHIKDISVIYGSQKTLAFDYLTASSQAAAGAAGKAQQLITGGAGSLTIAQVQTYGYISSAERAQLEGGLLKLGLSSAQIAALNMNQVKATFTNGAEMLAESANSTRDVEVDTRQTGAGITPVIGVNISPSENLNIGLKYEHKTVLTLTNDTRKSDANMDFLKDDQKISSDLPGIITAGVEYKFTPKFLTSVSFTEYLDKGIDWGNNIYGQVRTIESNSWELAIGLQYSLTENFALSAGGMQSTTGVSEQYQSDFSYSNISNTGAFGLEWKINEKLVLDAGMLFTVYKDAEKNFTGYKETYDKENLGFAIGLAYKIF